MHEVLQNQTYVIWQLIYLTLSFPFVGVLYNRVPTDEWYVLGTDGHGPDETGGSNEQRGGPQVYPAMSAWVWGCECQHRSWPPPPVHAECNTGTEPLINFWMCIILLSPFNLSCTGGINLNFKTVMHLYSFQCGITNKNIKNFMVLNECLFI